MNFLPFVTTAEYAGNFKIHLTFNDRLEGIVDFQQWLDGPVFEPLKDRSYFQQFFVAGGTVVWPNGADVAPETLYEAVKTNQSADAMRSEYDFSNGGRGKSHKPFA